MAAVQTKACTHRALRESPGWQARERIAGREKCDPSVARDSQQHLAKE